MGAVRLCEMVLVAGVTVLGILAGGSEARAQERAKIEVVPRIPHSDTITAGAFSADGTFLLSGSDDRTLKLWEASSGQLVRTFEGHAGKVNAVAFSPDGARLVSGSDDKTLRVWDTLSGKLLRAIEANSHGVRSVGFSPDGTRLVSGGGDKTLTLKLWDVRTGQLVRSLDGHFDGVKSVGFSPDQTRMFTVSGAELKIWEASTGSLLGSFKLPAPSLGSQLTVAESSRTATTNPFSATTKLSCGTRLAESGSTSSMGTQDRIRFPVRSRRSLFRLTADFSSPVAMTKRLGCGMLIAGNCSARSKGTPV